MIFHSLLQLTPVEYVRTLMVASLLSSRWHRTLPGVAHSEEPCEALLSRVCSSMARHPHLHTLTEIFDLFLLVPPPSTQPKDLVYNNVTTGLPQLVHRRMTILLRDIERGLEVGLVVLAERVEGLPARGAAQRWRATRDQGWRGSARPRRCVPRGNRRRT